MRCTTTTPELSLVIEWSVIVLPVSDSAGWCAGSIEGQLDEGAVVFESAGWCSFLELVDELVQ